MADHLQPGDIWRHPGMGTLYVTDEDIALRPGYFKCYWRMSGKAGLPVFMDATRTDNLTLVQRLGERSSDGEWRIKHG